VYDRMSQIQQSWFLSRYLMRLMELQWWPGPPLPGHFRAIYVSVSMRILPMQRFASLSHLSSIYMQEHYFCVFILCDILIELIWV
jgi:hypothetical protein